MTDDTILWAALVMALVWAVPVAWEIWRQRRR